MPKTPPGRMTAVRKHHGRTRVDCLQVRIRRHPSVFICVHLWSGFLFDSYPWFGREFRLQSRRSMVTWLGRFICGLFTSVHLWFVPGRAEVMAEQGAGIERHAAVISSLPLL